MRKIAVALLVVGIVGFAGLRPARAQSSVSGLVNVPFSFIIGDRLLPAGNYQISATVGDPTLLTIANVRDQRFAAFAATNWSTGPIASDASVQVAFKNVRGHMFLWRISMPGGNGRELVVTKAGAERTLAKLNLLGAEVGGNEVK